MVVYIASFHMVVKHYVGFPTVCNSASHSLCILIGQMQVGAIRKLSKKDGKKLSITLLGGQSCIQIQSSREECACQKMVSMEAFLKFCVHNDINIIY